jgi:cytidylate kinase
MYRAIALAVIESSIHETDDTSVGALAAAVDITLEGDPDSLKVRLDGRDVTERIRDEDVTETSSVISTIPAVRRAMVQRQRELGARGAVLNGRDIGTVVFPNADVKFFLTASPDERAQRRFDEDQALGASGTLAETLADMTERDRRDSTREDSPLLKADDAVLIDSSSLSIDEVFARMMVEIKRKSGGRPPS